MTWLSLGSLALPFQLQRQGVSLRNEIARLGAELTTGQTASPQRTLRGDTAPLAAIESRVTRIEAYGRTTTALATRTEAMQTALARLDTERDQASSGLLLASATGISSDALRGAGAEARAALDGAVSALSLRVGGQAAFSGTATDTTPLTSAEQIMATITALVSGLDSADAISTAVNAAFTDPGGLFDTTFYLGTDAGPAAMTGSETGGNSVLPTAAEPSVRAVLSGLVLGALVAEDSLALSQGQRQDLARQGALSLSGAGEPLVATQAQLGDIQGRLEAQLLQQATERDALVSSRQALIGIDPYDAVTRLEEARTQLETLYTVTARTSRLTLTEYLR